MTRSDFPDPIEYENIGEARAGLRARGIAPEVVEELVEAVALGTEECVERYGLRGDVDMDGVRRSLQVGTLEAVSGFVDAEVRDQNGIEELVSKIRENPVDELALIIGRMGSRSPDLRRISLEMYRERTAKRDDDEQT